MIETKELTEAAPPQAMIDLAGTPTVSRTHRRGFGLAAAALLVIAGLVAAVLIVQPWAGPTAPAKPSVNPATVEQREQAFRNGLRELEGPSSVDLSDQAFRLGLVPLQDGSKVDLSDDAFRHPFRPSEPAPGPAEQPQFDFRHP
jgi:hypothetical protein